jgi:hypothetical protein
VQKWQQNGKHPGARRDSNVDTDQEHCISWEYLCA